VRQIVFEDVLRLRPLLAAAGSDAGARRAVTALRENATLRVEVEGHTCNIGTAEYNLALGDRRANAVRDYLISRGISADRLRS
jgi:outer membrane protein OmpA-like peptidoglycan-associated protein